MVVLDTFNNKLQLFSELKMKWRRGPILIYSPLSRRGGTEGALPAARQDARTPPGGADHAAQHHPQRQHPRRPGGAAHRVCVGHSQRGSRGARCNYSRYESTSEHDQPVLSGSFDSEYRGTGCLMEPCGFSLRAKSNTLHLWENLCFAVDQTGCNTPGRCLNVQTCQICLNNFYGPFLRHVSVV